MCSGICPLPQRAMFAVIMKIAIPADIYMFKVRNFNLFSNNKFNLEQGVKYVQS